MPNGYWRPCPQGTFPYVIRTGDTFYSIARRYNTTVDALIAANPGVNPAYLMVGMTICVPQAVTPTICPPGTTTYVIRAGDTFYSIAQRYNTTVAAIQAANPGVNPNALYIGQQICVPQGTPPPTTCPPGTISYTVRAGDTFYSIAQRYNTTAAAIQAANPGVNPNALYIGQQICVPQGTPPPTTCPAGTISYTIRAGDTLFSIAQRYNTTVAAIQAANPGLDPNALRVGQRICVPQGTPPPPSTCPAGTVAYTVRAGDTFYSIAARFNTTVAAIQAANPGVDPNALFVGQRLCIPQGTPPPPPGTCPTGTIPYTVRAGDTFYSIAIRFNTTVAAIEAANPGVDPNALFVGQRICVPQGSTPPPPATCPTGTVPYLVRAGDTFYSIAVRFNTTVAALEAANPGVDPNALFVGQRICVPQGSTPPPPGTCPAGTVPYVIRSGDTFYSLAQRYGTTVAAIQAANPGVNPNTLQIGQRICIPQSTT